MYLLGSTTLRMASNSLSPQIPFLNHGQVVVQRSQTRLEGVVVEETSLVLVEITEHHQELL